MAESHLVKSKLDEFFWEWLSLPESQKIVRQVLQAAKGGGPKDAITESFPSPHFSALRGSPSGRPSPPGSPHSGRLRHGATADGVGEWPSTSPPSPSSPSPQVTSPTGASKDALGSLKNDPAPLPKPDFDRVKSELDEQRALGPLGPQTG